jgi:hypothetical protein
MRRLVLTLSAAAVLAVAATTARAGNPYYDPPVYAPNYGYQVNNYYGGWAAGPSYGGSDAHSEAVQRIMAAHSRYRYHTHPRSLYNSPPTQADYYGWGY